MLSKWGPCPPFLLENYMRVEIFQLGNTQAAKLSGKIGFSGGKLGENVESLGSGGFLIV